VAEAARAELRAAEVIGLDDRRADNRRRRLTAVRFLPDLFMAEQFSLMPAPTLSHF